MGTHHSSPIPVVNDLLGVISLYTVPTLTIDILTIVEGTIAQLYNPHAALWYQKTKYETRGVTIFDHLVRAAPTGWRLYYYIMNNRQYGDVWILESESWASTINDTRLLRSRVDFIRDENDARLFALGRDKVLEIYDDSKSSVVVSFAYPRRIIDVRIYGGPKFRAAISLLEDGTVWHNDSAIATIAPIASIFVSGVYRTSLITRDLQLLDLSQRGGLRLGDVEATGVIGAGYKGVLGYTFSDSVPVLDRNGVYRGDERELDPPIAKLLGGTVLGIRPDGILTGSGRVKLPEPVIYSFDELYSFGELSTRSYVGLSGRLYTETIGVPNKVPVAARIWQCGRFPHMPILIDGPLSAEKVGTVTVPLK